MSDQRKPSLLAGSLLVAGTCIGGGMLALPVLTSYGGFLPSLLVFFLCWLFMAATGLLYLEVCEWMEGDTNLISMAHKTLGRTGAAFAWVVYLFFFYCLTVAYMVGCGNLCSELFSLTEWKGILLFAGLFSPCVYMGARVVGRCNEWMMVGLALSYLAFFYLGYRYVDGENLRAMNWGLTFTALPIAFTSFGYQGIIPSLNRYMNFDTAKTRSAILIGSSLPLITYVIWQWLILGIVPLEGANGLQEAMHQGKNAVYPLKRLLGGERVYYVGEAFAFFAMTTSFFGVTLGLFDFLADGLKIEKTRWGRLLLFAIVFLPPLAIGITYPNIFIAAVDLAGGYGSALLLGALPVAMAWSGRYRLGLASKFRLSGGRALLLLLFAFVLFEIACESYFLLRS